MRKASQNILWISIALLTVVLCIFTVELLKDQNINHARENMLRVVRLLEEESAQDVDSLLTAAQNYDEALRLTIIDFDGMVLVDSFTETYDNHLNREEIEQLETFVVRRSDTLGKDMLYYAYSTDTFYVRLAWPLSAMVWNILQYMIVLGLFVVGLLFVGYWLIYQNQKLLLVRFQKSLTMLDSTIESRPKTTSFLEVEELPKHIEAASSKILTVLSNLEQEQEKSLFILNALSQGVIVLGGGLEILLINTYAKRIFQDAIDMHQLRDINLFQDVPEINKAILAASFYGKETTQDVVVMDKTHQMRVHPIDSAWAKTNKTKRGVLVTLVDVSHLRNLDNQKREFFANASHELKSPLTSVIGFTEMLEAGLVKTKEEQQEIYHKTLQEAKRMNQMVSEMLMLSQLETTKEIVDQTEVSLQEVLLEILDVLSPQIQNKNVQIVTSLQDVNLLAQREHMYHLFRNILDNAVFYNKIGGKVEVSLKQEGKRIVFICKDTGLGIPKEDIARIFERFYRVDKARSKANGGTGLGLAIVKHVLSLYRGSIHVNSKMGEFSEFIVQLPL